MDRQLGRARMTDPDFWERLLGTRPEWQSKLAPGNIIRSENNRYHIREWLRQKTGKSSRHADSIPCHPSRGRRPRTERRSRDLTRRHRRTKPARGQNGRLPDLNTSRSMSNRASCGNADLDVDEVLNEYCDKFYGPAAKQMKAAIDFCRSKLASRTRAKTTRVET